MWSAAAALGGAFRVVFCGDEMCAMADPGLAGRLFFTDRAAFFCAIMVSRKLGLLDMVLLLSPRPGRAGGSAFLEALGL